MQTLPRYTPVYVAGLLGLAKSNNQDVIFHMKSGGQVRSTYLSSAYPTYIKINFGSALIHYEDIERHEFTEKKLSQVEREEKFKEASSAENLRQDAEDEEDGYELYNLRGGYGIVSAVSHQDSAQSTQLQQGTVDFLKSLSFKTGRMDSLSDEEVLYMLKEIPPNDRPTLIKKLDEILSTNGRSLTGIMMLSPQFNQDAASEPQTSLETHRAKLRSKIEANGRK